MKKATLLLIRDTFTANSTTGKLFLNGKFFCYTLEDVVRPYGEKVPAKTAIPAGVYPVQLSMSSRFKRIMPMIYNQENGYELKAGGISFKGIRIHGGNTHKNTEGCVLVAHNKINDDLIQGTAERELTNALKDYDEIVLTVKNK